MSDYRDGALSVILKGNRPKSIVLPPPVAARLSAWLTERGAKPEDPILVNSFGARWTRSALSECFARLAKKAGVTRIAARAHQARYALNTLGRTLGLDVQERAALLSHSNTRTLHVYDRELADDGAKARATIWDALQRAAGETHNGVNGVNGEGR